MPICFLKIHRVTLLDNFTFFSLQSKFKIHNNYCFHCDYALIYQYFLYGIILERSLFKTKIPVFNWILWSEELINIYPAYLKNI